MRVLLLNRYSRMGASSRLRCLQYLPYLAAHGIEVDALPLFNDRYLETLYQFGKRESANVLGCYLQRVCALLTIRKYDLLWIQYEIFPWLPEWIEKILYFFRVPFVVDYDDAIFHSYNLNPRPIVRTLLGNKIERIMRRASAVIAGNRYIARRAYLSGAQKVAYLPTAIDLNRYQMENRRTNGELVIGWIGSPKTAKYLDTIKPALNHCANLKNTSLSLVGSGPVELNNIPINYYPWSEESEVQLINDYDIGIMPLSDTPWEKGKCGYKLIQYMASGKPVVASAVGANKEIVEHGINGFLAGTTEEWIKAFSILHDNALLRKKMGESGRRKVRDKYCLQVTGPKLLSVLKSVRDCKG
jgi:glycosyltransferase involved in cell wall biosynthesis